MKHHDAADFSGSPGPLFDLEIDGERRAFTAANRADGPFGRSKMVPTALEALIAGLIWKHQGREHPISIARLREVTSLDERAIKGVVADLIDGHKMRIGARRDEPVGYFIMRDAEDIQAGTGAYRAQLIAMARRMRILDPEGMPDLFGQMSLDEGGRGED